MSGVRQALIVGRKELKDSLRDSRALFSIVFTVLIGPAIVVVMMNRIADRQREADELVVPVTGEAHAPALVTWLQQQAGIEVFTGPGDAETAVRSRQHEFVLVISEEFSERFQSSRPAIVRIVADSSRGSVRPKVERLRRLLQRYSAEIGSLRLIGRGVSPVVVTPLQIEDVEVATPQQRAAEILAFIPMFIILAAFVGGMSIATDSTAGERERGSLEPLLVNPAPRLAIVAGKVLAAAVVAMVAVTLTTVLAANIPRFMPLGEMGIRFRIGTDDALGVLAAVLPMCLFSASLQAAVATLARSFKEAQSYMGVLILLPMIPGIIGTVYSIGDAPWMYAVPVLGTHVLSAGVLSGRPPEAWAFLLAAGVSVLAAGLLVQVTTTLFRSERIIFAR